jgi:hypothetical protein
MLEIHDYSERGLVNALFESIGSAKEPGKVWSDLIGRNRSWYSALRESTESTVRGLRFGSTVKRLAIYVEPSLSGFGNPDAVVLVDYEVGPNESHPGDAFFIEAKLETFASSSPYSGVDDEDDDEEAMRSNCSSLLHELFLKARFHELARLPKPDEAIRGHSLLTPGVFIYQKDKEPRKIGKNPQVLELAQAIATRSAYFVSLTTDETPPVNSPWPPELRDDAQLLKSIHELNEDVPQQVPKVPYGNPLGGWIEMSLQIGWDQVWLWAKDKGLDRMTQAMRENRAKFKCRPIERPDKIDEIVDFFDDTCGCNIRKSEVEDPLKTRPKWIATSRREGTIGTFDVVNGPDDQLWIVMHFSKLGPGLLTMEDVKELTEEGSADRNKLYARATQAGWVS